VRPTASLPLAFCAAGSTPGPARMRERVTLRGAYSVKAISLTTAPGRRMLLTLRAR